MTTEHLLIIRFSALGDVAMTVPVIYSLAHQYPNLRITVLSRPNMKVLFENIAPNVGFMAANIKDEYSGIRGLNKLYRRLLAKQFTAVADFHGVLRTHYLRLRFNMGNFKVEHIDKHRQGKRELTAEKNKKLIQQPTSFQNYADVLAKLGYPVKLQFTSIFPQEGGNLRLLPDKLSQKRDFQQWIGIAPFAAHKGKMYPLELTNEVINILINNHPSCRIFLFGGGTKEKEQINTIVEKHPINCISVPDQLKGMNQELILMSHLDCMVSMDSANMHLASLTNTPVVSVWGATHPYAGFLGWNQNPDNIVQLNLNCRPCSIYGSKPCMRQDFACMRNINPDTIAERVENVLKNR